jgi:LysM repeat protein
VEERPVVTQPTPEPVLPDLEPDPIEPVEPAAQEDPLADEPFTIVVEEGDTLESIAAEYVISVEKVRELNNLGPGEEIKAGQKLKMPFGIY